jgi:putative phosphoribosyl transferase
MEIFRDREDGGQKLAPLLEPYRSDDPLVMGLPRGGVIVAREVARILEAPLDVLVARKLGAPQQPELGLGAVAELDALWVEPAVVEAAGVDDGAVAEIAARERTELERRVTLYRRGRPFPDVSGRTVLLVDDGIATGGTMRAAIQALRKARAGRVVVAAPIAAAPTARKLEVEADDVICVRRAMALRAIGQRYLDFREVSDDEVVAVLDLARTAVRIPAGELMLPGNLDVPQGANGLVLVVSGRANGSISKALRDGGLGTLTFELLGPNEVESLSERMLAVTDWVQENPDLRGLTLGYFASAVPAAAALVAAARRPEVAAIVSRNGRPDLAGGALEHVRGATLLIAAGDDPAAVRLNDRALRRLHSERRLVLAPEAETDHIAKLAIAWFARQFAKRERATPAGARPH